AGFMIGCVSPLPATSWPSMTCVISYPMGSLLGVGCRGGRGAGGAAGSEVVALRGEILLVPRPGGLRGLEAGDGADGHVPPADAGRVRAVQVRVDHDRGRLVGLLRAPIRLAEGRGVRDLLHLEAVGADVRGDVEGELVPVEQAAVLIAHAVLRAEALAAM